MVNIVEFLRARLAADEAAARACAEVFPSPWDVSDRGHTAFVRADEPDYRVVVELEQSTAIDGWLGDRLDHIARHDPARVLREVEAKRRIVAHIAIVTRSPWPISVSSAYIADLNHLLQLLALPYADHPDFDPSWRVD